MPQFVYYFKLEVGQPTVHLHEVQGDALEAAHNMQSVYAVSLFYKAGACAYCPNNTYFTPSVFLVLASLLRVQS